MKILRNGLITKKIGTIQIFNNSGKVEPVTLILVVNNILLDTNFTKRDFNTMSLGVYNKKFKLLNKNIYRIFHNLDVFPKKVIKSFKTSKSHILDVGDRLGIDFFRRSQNVDISGLSLGKGFAGSMKRHGFKGLESTHGVSISHRSHGSTGQCQDPGKVFKGKKMAGHMGNNAVTIRNIKIIDIDYELGVLIVKGILPGFKNSLLYVKDSFKNNIYFKCI